jgi:hypothetical protein
MTTKRNIATKLHSIKNGIGGASNSPEIQGKIDLVRIYSGENYAGENYAENHSVYSV